MLIELKCTIHHVEISLIHKSSFWNDFWNYILLKNSQNQLWHSFVSWTNLRQKVVLFIRPTLTLPWRRSLSYRNQSINLQIKSMNWFLYDRDHRHERVKKMWRIQKSLFMLTFKRQSHKIVKHTETIRRQIADELFECVWPFCWIGA